MAEHKRERIEPLGRAALPAHAFSAMVPIRFGQCDAAGIVYTPHYFDMFNGVAERFFGEALGIDYYDLVRTRRLGLGYAHASCEFLKPNSMGETLEVVVMIDRVGGASYTTLFHALKHGTEVVRGRFVTATTALDTRRSVPVPPDIRAALETYRDRCLR